MPGAGIYKLRDGTRSKSQSWGARNANTFCLCIFIMSHRRFSVNLLSVVACMSRNSLVETVTTLCVDGCGFECCCWRTNSLVKSTIIMQLFHLSVSECTFQMLFLPTYGLASADSVQKIFSSIIIVKQAYIFK